MAGDLWMCEILSGGPHTKYRRKMPLQRSDCANRVGADQGGLQLWCASFVVAGEAAYVSGL